jgi:hypothetical protein
MGRELVEAYKQRTGGIMDHGATISAECTDRIHRFPQSDSQEFDLVVAVSPCQVGAAIPLHAVNAWENRFPQHYFVSVSILRRCVPAPHPKHHCRSPVRQPANIVRKAMFDTLAHCCDFCGIR